MYSYIWLLDDDDRGWRKSSHIFRRITGDFEAEQSILLEVTVDDKE